MFGFSIQKLIVLAAIVAAVWYGFKFVGQLDQSRKTRFKEALKPRKRAEKRAAREVEEMERCDACGSYVAAHAATSCGRGDCPYPG